MKTIWFDQALRDRWPTPLANEWRQQYPRLFDEDDLRITRSQPHKHFYEWLAAIWLFHTRGALSLVEKYTFNRAHPRKSEVIRRLLTQPQIAFLRELASQPPDLLVYMPTFDRYWFVEVKGPTDCVRVVQLQSNKAIRARFHVRVDTLRVRRAAQQGLAAVEGAWR